MAAASCWFRAGPNKWIRRWCSPRRRWWTVQSVRFCGPVSTNDSELRWFDCWMYTVLLPDRRRWAPEYLRCGRRWSTDRRRRFCCWSGTVQKCRRRRSPGWTTWRTCRSLSIPLGTSSDLFNYKIKKKKLIKIFKIKFFLIKNILKIKKIKIKKSKFLKSNFF